MLKIEKDKSLKHYSTFGIGGLSKFFTQVSTKEEMREALLFAKKQKIPFHIIGKGSNSLFPDTGFAGLAILNKIAFFEVEGVEVHVGAGYSFSLLGVKTAKLGLSGLEFASGIPATVGGAVFMNAGANGQETAKVLSEVEFMDADGNIAPFSHDQLTFSYRISPFHKKPGAILSARFVLERSEEARERQLEIIAHRTDTQPLKDSSCGCIFRNPEGESAGRLIEKCRLKGTQVGGATVSPIHANFIVNRGGATAQDVLTLAKKVKECVKQETGIELELELRLIDGKGFSR